MFKKNILRKLILFITIIIFFLLQTSIFKANSIRFPFPNLLIMLTCLVGFVRGKKSGMYTGMVCGLLIDVFSSVIIGFNALLFIFLGYFNGIYKRLFYNEDILMPLFLVSISDFAYNFIYYILFYLLKNRLNFGFYLTNNIFPELLFTIIVTLFAYPILLKVDKKITVIEKESESTID